MTNSRSGGNSYYPQGVTSGGLESKESRLRRNRQLNNITGHNGIDIRYTPDGIHFYGAAGDSTFASIFNLYNVSNTTIRIRGDMPDDIQANDGEGYSGDNKNYAVFVDRAAAAYAEDVALDTDINLQDLLAGVAVTTENFWFYLEVDTTSSPQWSVKRTFDPADMDTAANIYAFPLWYIPMDRETDTIRQGGILDLRHSPHLVTGADEDTTLTPDHDSPNSGTPPYRSTVEKNPTAGGHVDELQLYDVHGVATDTSTPADGRAQCIPMFQASSDAGAGELRWVAPDADRHSTRESNTDSRSIQIHDAGGRPSINSADQSDDEQLQLFEFDSPSSFTAGDTANDHILIRDADGAGAGPALRYILYTNFVSDIEGIIDPGNFTNTTTHTGLDFTGSAADSAAKAANADHDARYPSCDSPANGTDANAKDYTFTSSTVASNGDGVIDIETGGIYCGGGVYAKKGSATDAGYFENGVYIARLGEGGGSAAGLTDGTRVVGMCNGSQAIYAEGDILISGTTGDYYHNGNQGITDGDISGGIVIGQQPAIADPAGPPLPTANRDKIQEILDALRAFGIIET